jgi:predicted nucleic acid-binding protein
MDQLAYLDSSVVLRKLLRQSDAISNWTQWRFFSSELVDMEVRRTLHRYHSERFLTAESFAQRIQEWHVFREAIDLVAISPGILRRAAEPFPTSIKSLDAIHLATAIAWANHTEEPITVLTHDRPFGIAASACGFAVVP